MAEIEFENIWARYGLRDSPYNVKALSLIGSFNIEDVFCGREEELKVLGNRIHSTESSRTLIVGEIGTGKTTFANYLRWLLTRKNVKETKFLTLVDEMKVRDDWDYNKFLRETLFEIYNSSKIFNWEAQGIKFKTLDVIKNNLDLFLTKDIGLKETEITISNHEEKIKKDIPSELLRSWFLQLCEEIKGYNKSFIFHYNNLEAIHPEKLGALFMSIKELIQIPNTHWFFLGPSDILSTIENKSQIHSIFHNHLMLEPLSEDEILKILKKRCNALKDKDVNYIKPYEDDTVKELHKKLNGNIRFIFKLLEDTTNCLSSVTCKATIQEINAIQEKEKRKILSRLNENQQKIIALLIERGEMTLTELSDGVDIKPQNLQKDLRELRGKTFIAFRDNPDDKRSKLVRLSQNTYLSFVFSQEKSVALMEYLIKTYTNEDDLVLDNCMGSGTTGVACKNLNRDFIGIEIDEKYFKIAKERINDALATDSAVGDKK